jgi:hypothetical protein
VAASFLEQYWVPGGTALRVASYIRHVLRCVEQAGARLGPDRLCAVRYEDLVDHPERELRRLCGFLGEDYDPSMLRFAVREDTGYLEVEEGWKGLTRQELTRKRVGRYRARLTPRQIWTIERRLAASLPRLGYEASSPASVPLTWHVLLWGERLYRKALHTVGVRRDLLDEQAVRSRRDQQARERGLSREAGESR